MVVSNGVGSADDQLLQLDQDDSYKGDPAQGSYALGPAWSPDGEQIAFVREGYPGAPAYSSAIYIMDSDGSAPALVRKFPGKDAENLYWR